MRLQSTSATNATGATVHAGTVRYLHQGVAHSLYRNGQVLTRRDRDGNDADTEGMIFDARQITAHNARLPGPRPGCTLSNNGFELVTQPLANRAIDFFDHHNVIRDDYDECAQTVKAGQSLLDSELVEHVLSGGARDAIINVWRNIADQPVATHPLALCDARSVQPEDLVVFEIHYADRVGESYFSKHSAHHDWVDYPRMTRDEVLLIKQWDSAGTGPEL